MKLTPWREIRTKGKLSKKELEQIDREVGEELLEMDLRELRAAALSGGCASVPTH